MSSSTIEVPANSSAGVFSFFTNDEPIRAEQFGQEHLEAHARRLAAATQRVVVRPGHPLLRRFEENRQRLIRAHRVIAEAHRKGEKFGSDADWLLDNFHIISESLAEVSTDLPHGYYNQLPKIATGPMADLPRAYCLALELVAHCDSALDETRITSFVQAFQSVTPLTIGELWAVPIMFRLVLLDNLRRLANQIVCAMADRIEAKSWVARHFPSEEARPQPGSQAATPEPMALRPDCTDEFVLQLFELLRDQEAGGPLGVGWLEDSLAARGVAAAEVTRRGHQRQAATQISIGNCVTSLRLLSALDWADFFEETSAVESILRGDPAGIYPQQDFPTRDRYRREIEKLSRGSDSSEVDVVERALALSNRPESPSNHVGYYLIGPGRRELDTSLNYRPNFSDRMLMALLANARLIYFGGISLATLLILTALVLLAMRLDGTTSLGLIALALLIAAFPASEWAVEMINGLIVWLVPPQALPRIHFPDSIPADYATFVVIPSMLVRTQNTAALLEHLEIHFLSNPDQHLYFALLTDYADAPHEHEPGDAENLRFALDGIRTLNQRHASGGPDRFFLFHRHRRWNPSENCWMGWERKRGKLAEFNRLLRDAAGTSYSTISGELKQIPRIRFVITLDSDTQLPREAAQRLIGTLAHPLNEPEVDPDQGRVVRGYGVLQPRISISFASSGRSRFAHIVAGSAGIDPYVTAVSDVYQDLFSIGSFTGKGIYDVDAFAASAGRAFPENRILSHDLIEGDFARCGLVSNIELLDEFPVSYPAYARREHRWVRGDWQILQWLFPRVPTAEGTWRPNPLPLVERWKVFDNLRRSLVAPAAMALLLLGWLLMPKQAWLLTIFIAIVLGWPLLGRLCSIPGRLLASLIRWPRSRVITPDVSRTAGHLALRVIFLADQARLMIDAIGRTLFRLFWSHRRLLEWETAAATERRLGASLGACWRLLWLSPSVALLVGFSLVWLRPPILVAAAPFLIAWFLAPTAAYWLAQPREVAGAPLTKDERKYLRYLARKTWGFFESFVQAEDNWLPPDNFQEDPKGEIAHRTSPTNMGLYLLSCLAAHDFGYLSLPALAERLDKTFATFDRLERSHGHFYNWYDTTTLQPLFPAYVSTVDSGNLLGCLITLKQGLAEKVSEPLPSSSLLLGLRDALDIAARGVRNVEPGEPASSKPMSSLNERIRRMEQLFEEKPRNLLATAAWLERLQHETAETNNIMRAFAQAIEEPSFEPLTWTERLAREIENRIAEMNALAPWLSLIKSAPATLDLGSFGEPTGGGASHVSASATPWAKLRASMSAPITVAECRSRADLILTRIEDVKKHDHEAESQRWLEKLAEAVRASGADKLLERCRSLERRADDFGREMNFKFLYNERRHLFAVGFNMSHGRLDNAHYDLLASEASLTSFLAVARGDVPKKHWFHLGRPCANSGKFVVLLSWGGTMFEYLMPRLMMRDFPGTFLDVSRRAAVVRQIEYGRRCKVPWGISESAFGALDGNLNYQYQSFGVPGLGLKRGLAADLVVAPYATFLAAMIDVRSAIANLRGLEDEGAGGAFGFYEAIDYTRMHQQSDSESLIVKCFMAHHQGMSLLALANCLLGDRMPQRFHAEPMVRATELLLQERVPEQLAPVEAEASTATEKPAIHEHAQLVSRRLTTPFTTHPRTHLLSNGEYTVMVTNAGAGRSSWRGLDVTRWREDRTCDSWGQFCYLRDLESGRTWSAGYQPVGQEPDEFEVVYAIDKAEFRRVDGLIETYLEITVSPEAPAEIRSLTITNHDIREREIELTSYAELVLGPHAADLAHPAFGKLFLQTEFLHDERALLCHRRPRSAEEKPIWCVHVLSVDGPIAGDVQYETDRARFLGRGRTPGNAAAMESRGALSGTIGSVLDPIFSLRCRVKVAPDGAIHVSFTTGTAETREQAVALADQYHDYHGVQRAFDLAWAHCQVELRHLHLSAQDAHLFQRLGAHVIYASAGLRPAPGILISNRQGQPGLWRYGISGDVPIVLARVAEADQLRLIRELLAAHEYLRLKGLEFDLVILNEHETSYFEDLHQQILGLARSTGDRGLLDKRGGVFLRKASHISPEDLVLLQSAARCVLSGARGSLAGQIDRLERGASGVGRPPRPQSPMPRSPWIEGTPAQLRPVKDLQFSNGWGGFASDGREYVIELNGTRRSDQETPPAPWINVVANPAFGFLVSEMGLGCTWSGNSQLNRLTPWRNDPVSDSPSEIIYVRDEATGEYWSPTPLPIRMADPCRVRHGQGYTVFERNRRQIEHELLVLTPPKEPIKLISLKLRNLSGGPRRLSVTFFAEWVLGVVRDQSAMHVYTDLDSESGVLCARNSFQVDFGSQIAFADVNIRPRQFTADRTEFLGRNGNITQPAGMTRSALNGVYGAALDPCAALRVFVELGAGEQREVVFLLGQADRIEKIRALTASYRQPGASAAALSQTIEHWDQFLGTVQVRTPNRALDLLINRWLLYQVTSCRLWGRTALYQSGGAFGFRDQLQDVMALMHAGPNLARAQIVLAASRQFPEGDVQHWWHPPSGVGVRTRCSDDFLWLPFVASHYASTTGDYTVFDEPIQFIDAPDLRADQDEDYRVPSQSNLTTTLFDHCLRAIEHGCRFGSHGLPLMGTGDWNDGMNRVGSQGKGESVWNGWFLFAILRDFAAIAAARNDPEHAREFSERAQRLRTALEEHAWDGQWYRRAFWDDGTPLGSAENEECRIDSIAQTWAIISGAAGAERAGQAWASLEQFLVKSHDRLILLFTPPFDHGAREPGYIKGYVPGIRENGGQYTHAAVWCVQAAVMLGMGTRAVELFDLLNPILHASSPEEAARYRVEPYVMAGDVYGEPPHTGRGGWTWYTGSAGWMYRVALESILGFQRQGQMLSLNPCIPKHWTEFEITYRYQSTVYHIQIRNPHQTEHGVKSIALDGMTVSGNRIDLVDDGKSHEVIVELGS